MSDAIFATCHHLKIAVYQPRFESAPVMRDAYQLAEGQSLLPCPYLCLLPKPSSSTQEAVLALLQNVLLYLKIPPHLCCVVYFAPAETGLSQAQLLKTVKPKTLISFGVGLPEIASNNVTNRIASQNLEDALMAPMLKEKILADVYQLSL